MERKKKEITTELCYPPAADSFRVFHGGHGVLIILLFLRATPKLSEGQPSSSSLRVKIFLFPP